MRVRSLPFLVSIAVAISAIGFTLDPSAEESRYSTFPVLGPSSLAAQVSFCIASACQCGDDAARKRCRDTQRANFERDNPPRGMIDGVCYAFRYKDERDPATGNSKRLFDQAIFSKVRFNETEVFSSEHHDRDAGFEYEVGTAWYQFVAANYIAKSPETDGWRWYIARCASLNSPRRNEAKDWESTQQATSFTRVFMPTYGIADTPEERALEAKLAAERKAREAERARQAELARQEAAAKAAEAERQRRAAEAARQAEIARREAERQRQVDRIAQELGPGKRAAAERLHKMNEEVAALRPKPRTPAPQCTTRSFTQPVSASGQSQAGALANLKGPGGLCRINGSESRKSETLGAANCTQRQAIAMKPPPVGNCLSCISEKMAINMYGYVPGKGYPPPPSEWVCNATVQCVVESCNRGPSRVNQQ